MPTMVSLGISMSVCLQVALPDEGQREAILRLILRKHVAEGAQPHIDPQLLSNQPSDPAPPLRAIAHSCAGFSGSDLVEMCSQAVSVPVHEALAEHRAGQVPGGIGPVSLAHFQRVLSSFRPAMQLARPEATERLSESERLVRLLLYSMEHQRQPDAVETDGNAINGKTSN